MRAYTVATTAVALNTSPKWVDNILSQHHVPGVVKARQGIARRLSQESVVVLEITLRLCRAAIIPTHRALQIARDIASSAAARGTYPLGPGIELMIDKAAIVSEIATRLAEAVEFAPTPRRGRPPSRR